MSRAEAVVEDRGLVGSVHAGGVQRGRRLIIWQVPPLRSKLGWWQPHTQIGGSVVDPSIVAAFAPFGRLVGLPGPAPLDILITVACRFPWPV